MCRNQININIDSINLFLINNNMDKVVIRMSDITPMNHLEKSQNKKRSWCPEYAAIPAAKRIQNPNQNNGFHLMKPSKFSENAESDLYAADSEGTMREIIIG